METLHRSRKNKVILGVCGGLAEYFRVDPVLVRIISVLIAIPGPGLLMYLVAALVMPSEKDCQSGGGHWGDNCGGGFGTHCGTNNGSDTQKGSYSDYSTGTGTSGTDFESDFESYKDEWDHPPKYRTGRTKAVLGTILVGIGALILGEKLFPALFRMEIMAPVLLIIIGVVILKGRK